MASKYDYVPTTQQELNDAFGQSVDLNTTAGLLMLTSIAGPKEKQWEEECRLRDNGTVKSTRVTKKQLSIDIFKANSDKNREQLLILIADGLGIHRYAACDYYRYCDENRKEILEGM